jgi:anthranilate synthase component 1
LPSASKADRPAEESVTSNFTDEAFCSLVEKAKKHIYAGDVFQVVLSRRFEQHFTVDPFDIYRALRLINPSPYLFYLDEGDYVIVGASPEKLISVEGRLAEVRPIAGTRRRTVPENDAALIESLFADEKEIAEHTMLVDLGRNDLGKICEPGSVKVTELMTPEIFSHVIHLTSTVQGKLNPDVDGLTAIFSAFPAGTLSGAPKVRAMELINEFEKISRGLYGGSIVMFDAYGNVNSCIAIRMAILKDQVAYIQTGAGVVMDSDPQAEADETRAKAQALLKAISVAEGGLS